MKIVKTVYLKAPAHHVWRFLTEADLLALWFHKGESDVKAGGDWAVVTNTLGKEGERLCYGKVLEARPHEKLVHTFTHQWLNGVETVCTWRLEDVPGGTILTLTHEGFEKLDEEGFRHAADHDAGWDEHFIRLRRVTA
ncbi:MAG: SRPBCC domain-containing protein [Pseudomonadota bacterium]|nr:SRPBCC domain-containing protein [Pseudomonadota bacterium]